MIQTLTSLAALGLVFAGMAIPAQAQTDQLPALVSPVLRVSTGQGLAAVQPSASIDFKFSSCVNDRFVADVNRRGFVHYVTIRPARRLNACRNSQRLRIYDHSVQISSDFQFGSSVILRNPTVLESR